MRVTLKYIAEIAGVSSACVSNILNGKTQEYSEATIQKVKTVAKENHYRVNSVARSMVTKSTMTIGLILPDISNSYYGEVAKGVEEKAFNRGYTTIHLNTNENAKREKEAFRTLEDKMVDGVVFIPSVNSFENTELLEKLRYPILAVDRNYFTKGIVETIIVDDYKGSVLAVQHLVGRGKKHILYLSGNRTEQYSSNDIYDYFYKKKDIGKAIPEQYFRRELGFFDEILKNKCEFNREHFIVGQYTPEFGYAAVEEALGKSLKFDALYADSDMVAIGAMQALLENGITIPKEVAVIGYDNIFITKYLNPALTTIDQPKYEMGRKAADLLIDIMQDDTKSTNNVILLEPQIIVRKST